MTLGKMKRFILISIPGAFLLSCATHPVVSDPEPRLSDEELVAQIQRLEQVPSNFNSETRRRLLLQREAQVQQSLKEAEGRTSQGDLGGARTRYEHVLKLEVNNQRAKAGIAAVEAAGRNMRLIGEARAQVANGEWAAAEASIRQVLQDDPRNKVAGSLYKEVLEKSKPASGNEAAIAGKMGKKISLEFNDANVKSVLEFIGRSAGINLVFDKDVRPDMRATITLKDSTITDAIKVLLLANQLESKVLNDSSILVYPNTPQKAADYQELVVRGFYLANADVKQTLNLLKTIIKTKDVYIDEKLNLLIMRDTADAVRLAEKLIAMQDLAEPEVVLEVEVMEVTSNLLEQLGIRYPTQISSSLIGGAGIAGQLTLAEARGVTSDMIKLSVTDPALALNFAHQDGETNTLANPRIRVRNREKAKIHIGDRVPVITSTSTATGFVSESVNYLDVGLKLDVEPNVYLDSDVAIKVGLEVSSIISEVNSRGGTLSYRVGTRSASTVLRLKDGETQILAGLISDEERKSLDKVPGLAGLPLVGRLFTNTKDSKTKTEIVLLVTPRIIRNYAIPAEAELELSSGTASNISGGLNRSAAGMGMAPTGSGVGGAK